MAAVCQVLLLVDKITEVTSMSDGVVPNPSHNWCLICRFCLEKYLKSFAEYKETSRFVRFLFFLFHRQRLMNTLLTLAESLPPFSVQLVCCIMMCIPSPHHIVLFAYWLWDTSAVLKALQTDTFGFWLVFSASCPSWQLRAACTLTICCAVGPVCSTPDTLAVRTVPKTWRCWQMIWLFFYSAPPFRQ